MVVKPTLKDAFENGDWKGLIDAIESVCVHTLGYRLVNSCHCVEKTPKSEVKKLQEKVDKFYEQSHRLYQLKDEERPYVVHCKTFHYRNSKKDRGIIFTVEGCREIIGSIRGTIKRGLRKGTEHGETARRQKTGVIGLLKRVYQDRQNILPKIRPVIELGTVTCNVYVENYKGNGSLSDFECKSGKSWRTELKIPKEAVLENVNFLEL